MSRISNYAGMGWAALKRSGAMPNMGEVMDGTQTVEDYITMINDLYNTAQIDIGEATRMVAIPIHYVALNQITAGYYSKTVATVFLPQYYNDPRMTALLTDINSYLGIGTVLTIVDWYTVYLDTNLGQK